MIMSYSDATWTERDTKIYEKGFASGMAVNISTRKPITFTDLKLMAKDYDRVRGIISVDTFLDHRIYSEPFERKQ